jgi:hypothetical protein
MDTDPMATRPETQAALSSPHYVAAFNAIMSGAADVLTEPQRAAVEDARRLTGVRAPALPLAIASAGPMGPGGLPGDGRTPGQPVTPPAGIPGTLVQDGTPEG